MTPEFVGELIPGLMILSGFLLTLAVGGFVADYILPRIPFVQRFLDTLPDWDGD